VRALARSLIPTLAAASAALALVLVALSLTTRHVGAVVSLLFFLTLVVASAGLIAMAAQRKPPTRPTPSVVTVVSCLNCEYREEREYRAGAFVLKKLGSGAKCGGELFISAIYAVAKAREGQA